MMRRFFRPALSLLLFFTAVTGFLYPLAVAGLARLLFPHQAAGSIIERRGVPVGSVLLGQAFDDTRHFRGRPSATGPIPSDADHSGGSNLGPTNPGLVALVRGRVADLRRTDPGGNALIPVDLVTASGSGLDPHISPAAAEYQVLRVAAACSLPEAKVRALVAAYTEGRQFGVLGEPRVNVLLLNLALEEAP